MIRQDMPYISEDIIRIWRNLGSLGRCGHSVNEGPIQQIEKEALHCGGKIITGASSSHAHQGEYSATSEVIVRRMYFEEFSCPVHSNSRVTEK
jgi:hypothetical protein